MCVVVAYDLPGSEMHYMVAVKGAPETLKTMVSEVMLVYNSKYRYSRLMLFVIFYYFSYLLYRRITTRFTYLFRGAVQECLLWDIVNLMVSHLLKT